MSRVIIFSRTYPAYHPKYGNPTYFPEKFYNVFWDGIDHQYCNIPDMLNDLNYNWTQSEMEDFSERLDPEIKENKHHTVRSGHRFKVGDYFSPRVWSGIPYNSKQIILAPDIEVKKVWDLVIKKGTFYINGVALFSAMAVHGMIYITQSKDKAYQLSANDGLSIPDFLNWFRFPREFDGQIICWSDKIQY